MSKIDPEILKNVVAIFTDGGVIRKNPSAIGGTWAFVLVNNKNENVHEASGVVPATATRSITNNQTEQIAIIKALEAMPENWTGIVFSDSKIALGRVFSGWKTEGLTQNIIERSARAVARLGAITPILMQGHPTKACLSSKHDTPILAEKLNAPYRESAARHLDGIGKKHNLPVSRHNVRCDQLCGEAAEKHLAELTEELAVMANCPQCGGLVKPQTVCSACADVHREDARNLMAEARRNFFEKGASRDYGETNVA